MNKNEQINKNQNRIIAFSIFAIAMMLTIIPFPEFITHYMPDWGLMALIFLSINLPKEFNLSTAFFVGLITDVIKGTILGQHSLSSLIIQVERDAGCGLSCIAKPLQMHRYRSSRYE